MLSEKKGEFQYRLKKFLRRSSFCQSSCLSRFCLNFKDHADSLWIQLRSFSKCSCQFLRQYRPWSSVHTALLVLFFFLIVTLYRVQYKMGIEILPFLPIDDSGFDKYNENLLVDVDLSETASTQPKKGFLFCWVMTAPIHHMTRVKAVNATWLPKCDAGHFYTTNGHHLSQKIPFHTIFNALPDSYFKLFWKTRLALLYTYKYVSKDFEWYFKGDDDTYVIVETLREYLKQFDSNKPYYIGYRLKRRMSAHGYNAGGSGYAMSRAAMKIFAEELFPSRDLCPYHEWEDLAIARCLASKGIHPTDTRDLKGRQRFLAWRPEEHFHADLTRSFIFDKVEHQGFDIYHEKLISLHHLQPDEMRLIHGILYGVSSGIYNQMQPGVKAEPLHALNTSMSPSNDTAIVKI